MLWKRSNHGALAFERKRYFASEDSERLFKESRYFVKPKSTYSDLKYSIRILNNGDESYTVEVPKLPGCYSTGKTKTECLTNILEAIELHMEGLKSTPPIDPIPSIEVIHELPAIADYLISLPEATKFLSVSDATIRRYIKSGRVPAYNFGKEYKFKVKELSDFVDSCRVTPKSSRARRTG